MAAIPGSVRVGGFIAPTDSTDIYAVTDPKYGRGSLRSVADIAERDAITLDRRQLTMEVTCQDTMLKYVLINNPVTPGTTSSDWQAIPNNAFAEKVYNDISYYENITPTQILTTTGAGDLAAKIATLVDGDILEIQANASYTAITIPVGMNLAIRVAEGYDVELNSAQAITLNNGANNVFLSGFIFDSNTGGGSSYGSAVGFQHQAIVNNIIFYNCTFRNNNASAVLLSYHQSIGGDFYYTANLLSEFSTNISFVQCNFDRAANDATEGAAIVLRGIQFVLISECNINARSISRGLLLQNCLDCYVCNNKIMDAGGSGNGEGIKLDLLGSPLYFNTGTFYRNRVHGCIEGIDIDDVVLAFVNENIVSGCTNEGISLDNDSKGVFVGNITFNNQDGIGFELGSVGNLKCNVSFNNTNNNYRMDNGYVPDNSNTTAISDTFIGADKIPYDNSTSSLTSTLVNNAIDEVYSTLKSEIGISAGAATTFYLDDTNIIPTGVQNNNEVNTLTKTPITTAEIIDSVVVNNNTVLKEVYLHDTALSGIQIEAGNWEFDIWRQVSILAGTSEILINMMLDVYQSGTVTITGAGTSRTATSSSTLVFVSGDANADMTIASYLMTPTGFFQITGFTSDQIVTIEVPATYVNETAVAFSKHRRLFQVTTGDINNLALTFQAILTVQSAFPISAGDKLSAIYFGRTTNVGNVTISYTHNGNARYTHFESPLALRHNELAGVNSASISEPSGHIPNGDLPDGTTATTQLAGDNTTKLATDAFVQTELEYTNAAPTPSTLGGIPSGSTFAAQANSDMWTALLYPYQYPAFTSFSISGQATSVEVGVSISGAHTFTWVTSNSSNVATNSINIYDITGAVTLFTGLANDGSEPYAFPSPIQLILPGSYVWQIEGTNTHVPPTIFNRNLTINWYWRRHWGTSALTSLTSAQILALASSDLSSIGTGSFSFAAGDYKYFCIPTSFTQPTNFIDHSTGFPVAMESPVVVSVTNAYSIVTNYNVYRTTNTLASTITIDIS